MLDMDDRLLQKIHFKGSVADCMDTITVAEFKAELTSIVKTAALFDSRTQENFFTHERLTA
jgi:hypothetical protein